MYIESSSMDFFLHFLPPSIILDRFLTTALSCQVVVETATGILDHPLSSAGGGSAARRPHDLDLDLADTYMMDTDPLLHRPTGKNGAGGKSGGKVRKNIYTGEDDDCGLLDA